MLTEEESEILGIMIGDGCMSRTERSVQIVITGNKVDDENYFLGHVRPLFLDVFDLELTSRYRQNENTMDLYRHSKKVALTLHSWGMPFGETGRPETATEGGSESVHQGVFDTDGSVYRKYGPYAQIQFKTVSNSLMFFIRKHLIRLGFHPTQIRPDETKHRFQLCRQNEVEMFFRIVLPFNRKHLDRLRQIRCPDAI